MALVVDVHVHLAPPEIIENRSGFLAGEGAWAELYRDAKALMLSTSDLLAVMDEEGIDKALVMGFPWAREDTAKRHNEWLLNEAEKNPGRLVPMAAFDLLAAWGLKHAEEMLAAGHFGLGELALYDRGFGAAELDLLEACAGLCRQSGKVFLMHVNEPIGHQYPGKAPLEIGQIFDLVLRCQGVKLILAHFGGGLPFFAALKKEIKEALENVRFDTAAMPFIFDPKSLVMALKILGPEYFLLGTDFPLLRPSRYRKYFNDAGLSADEQKAIMGLSAADFLELN